jgi:hypothetical protein
MTNADIIVRILSETTGKPERLFRAILAGIPSAQRGKLDELCPDAPAVLARLRQEKAGILNWVIQAGGIRGIMRHQVDNK